jgi:hypothetical protein
MCKGGQRTDIIGRSVGKRRIDGTPTGFPGRAALTREKYNTTPKGTKCWVTEKRRGGVHYHATNMHTSLVTRSASKRDPVVVVARIPESWDRKIWLPWVQRGPETRMTVLARTSNLPEPNMTKCSAVLKKFTVFQDCSAFMLRIEAVSQASNTKKFPAGFRLLYCSSLATDSALLPPPIWEADPRRYINYWKTPHRSEAWHTATAGDFLYCHITGYS